MDGILLVDKPKGWTSHDVVAKVRNILRTATSNQQLETRDKSLITNSSLLVPPSMKVKVGHTGTLDPLATGLLVLLIGSYTKRAQEISKLYKTYEVAMQLGQTSTTGDAEGDITPYKPYQNRHVPKKVRLQDVEEVFRKFMGEIKQVPPAYSAVKVEGQRAYKLARAGKKVDLNARKVTVFKLQLTEYTYPEVKFTAKVSSGTYIRSLVGDIGKAVGTGAYMSGLRRTEVGKFNISDAVKVTGLSAEDIKSEVLTSID